MTEKGLIEEYYEQLLKSKTPNLILAKVFRDLFERDLQKSDWPRMGKLINLYGKFIVLEAFIRAGMNTNFDNSSPWGYLNSICLSLSKESRESLEDLEKIRLLKEKTQQLLDELNKPPKKIKMKKRDYLNES